MLRRGIASLLGVIFFWGFAQGATSNKLILSKRLSKEQKQEIFIHNLSVTQSGDTLSSGHTSGLLVQRPVAEYEDTGYLIFQDYPDFTSAEVKAKLIQNLPEGVTAVIYSDSAEQSELEALYRYYSEMAPKPEQVKIIHIPNPVIEVEMDDHFGNPEMVEVLPNGFWSRDAIPVPVVQLANRSPMRALSERFTVVDAKYYHFYEPDQIVADYFTAALLSHKYYFEGGNFMANSKGDCLVVNTDETDIIPNTIFSRTYGCNQLVRLPFIKGIGHADESVKFVSDDHVLTDDRRYKRILEGKGFKVTMLPRPKRDMETYVNSLMINGTVWVPIFKQPNDSLAIKTYEDLGFKVVPVDTSILSNEGAGSIHCITMTYPKTTDFNELLSHLGAKNVVSSVTPNVEVEKRVVELKAELQEHKMRLKSPDLESYLDSLYLGWGAF